MALTKEDIAEALKFISEMNYNNIDTIDQILTGRFPQLMEAWSILPPLDLISDDETPGERKFPANIPVPESIKITEDQLDRKTIGLSNLKAFADAIVGKLTLAWGLVQKYPGGQISVQVVKRRIIKKQLTVTQFLQPLPPLPSPAVSISSAASTLSSLESLASIGNP